MKPGEKEMTAGGEIPAPLGCPCRGRHLETLFTYRERPAGETAFPLPPGQSYGRRILRCRLCDHMVSVHHMDLDISYRGGYVDATYRDARGLERAFERVVALAPERSDNQGRVARLLEFARSHWGGLPRRPRALDVGSGLCVFLQALKRAGWAGTALDPDRRAVEHARRVVGVEAIEAEYLEASLEGRFHLVSFIKVLEHVLDPVAMLARSLRHLLPGGLVYVEVPDGAAAARQGPGRQEFFIDHHHIFSPASATLLARRAGLELLALERLVEPSGKYTLRLFLEAGGDTTGPRVVPARMQPSSFWEK